MARWPLLGGAYEAQSVIANAQRCINLYPEKNPASSPVPVTYYPTPGLRQVAPGLGLGRGMYVSMNGIWFGVSGTSVWWRDSEGTQTVIGTIPLLQTPVRFVDNGIELCLLDGTEGGAWTINLKTKAFSRLVDDTDTFSAAVMGTYLDTFAIFPIPSSREFIVSLPNSFLFDNDVGSKTAYPDPLCGVVSVHRELWLIGTKTTEIWTTVANEDFPFQIIPGAFVEYGCGAPYSIATADTSVFWLAQNEEGQAMVLRGRGYEALRISNHALENAMQKYITITDAQAYTYQENGHIFYVLNFPSEDKTWAFDEATGEWHQRAWMDSDGGLHRARACSVVTAYNKRYAQDWESGTIYETSVQIGTDDGREILRLRSFPHLPTMQTPKGVVGLEGKRVKYHKFTADISVGGNKETNIFPVVDSESLLTQQDEGLILTDPDNFGILLSLLPGGVVAPKLMLRWSNSRGAAWDGVLVQSLGAAGEYKTSPSFWRLGIARDRVWELSWTAPANIALNGAWVEMTMMKS